MGENSKLGEYGRKFVKVGKKLGFGWISSHRILSSRIWLFSGYPEYPGSDFFTPDIRPYIGNPVNAGYPVSGTKHELFKFSTLYQRKIKTKIDVSRLKMHIIRRLGCSIPRTKSTSRIYITSRDQM